MEQRYTVTARRTGDKFSAYAPDLGPGWMFVLSFPGEPERFFTNHTMAHVFARRLQGRIAA